VLVIFQQSIVSVPVAGLAAENPVVRDVEAYAQAVFADDQTIEIPTPVITP